MPVMFNEDDLNQQQRVKCAFDPSQILNPGKVFTRLHRGAALGRPRRPRRIIDAGGRWRS
jgi:glycolate oxidase